MYVRAISPIDFVMNDEYTFWEGEIAEEGTSCAEKKNVKIA